MADTQAVTFCCETMKGNAERRCDEHPDPFDCPDSLIFYSQRDDRYGLIIHDGGSSYIAINYCPWCGATLPNDDDCEPRALYEPVWLDENEDGMVFQAGAFPTEAEAQKVIDIWHTEGLREPVAINFVTFYETAEQWEANR